MTVSLKQAILEKSRQLGFVLAGVTTPEPPPHYEIFKQWVGQGLYGTMNYLADERSLVRRADPRLILPKCKSILLLAIPYSDPKTGAATEESSNRGRVASYAWGDDYHEILPKRLKELVGFIEKEVGRPVSNRYYTDTGPILERDLAQRAGLGWIGKNTCLINPTRGSYFLLAEILLDLELEPDPPFITDHCGTCTRCLDACPTHCIRSDRTIDARQCISYLTIELKDDIPLEMSPLLKDWIFGCDVCQMVCPWNRFADEHGDSAFESREGIPLPVLTEELNLTSRDFNQKFKLSPIKRTKRRGYLRNVAVVLGNNGDENSIPALCQALEDPESLVQEHVQWAIKQIQERINVK